MDIIIRKSIKEDPSPLKKLSGMGFDEKYESSLPPELVREQTIARVTGVRKNLFLVNDGHEERSAAIVGKFHHQAPGTLLFPATGDWVVLDNGRIAYVLPRKNALSRGASGRQGKKDSTAVENQVIAANLDWVFIVCGLDRDFNIRRIERYLTLVYNCGCTPVVILTKSDLHDSPEPFVRQVEAVSFGVPVHPVSAVERTGIQALAAYLAPGKTVALLGSSGAGKSTLVNFFAGKEIQATREVSQHVGKGVHTTTTRDLIRLPGGRLLIDNPGIREIAFWDVGGTAGSAFPEIDAWAGSCRFSDCTHTGEPGCRVRQACLNGELEQERLDSYLKQMRELDYLAQRKHKSADRVEKERWKSVSRKQKQMKKYGKPGR
ncbi:MAG: ribosome small subunit-dependent GTPase A [Desulfobacteraceae bacterium]|nr:ribosome small subunit-dependent GTPase A [Desulfobacteraceae bacterium]